MTPFEGTIKARGEIRADGILTLLDHFWRITEKTLVTQNKVVLWKNSYTSYDLEHYITSKFFFGLTSTCWKRVIVARASCELLNRINEPYRCIGNLLSWWYEWRESLIAVPLVKLGSKLIRVSFKAQSCYLLFLSKCKND